MIGPCDCMPGSPVPVVIDRELVCARCGGDVVRARTLGEAAANLRARAAELRDLVLVAVGWSR